MECSSFYRLCALTCLALYLQDHMICSTLCHLCAPTTSDTGIISVDIIPYQNFADKEILSHTMITIVKCKSSLVEFIIDRQLHNNFYEYKKFGKPQLNATLQT